MESCGISGIQTATSFSWLCFERVEAWCRFGAASLRELQVPAHFVQDAEEFLRQDAILAHPGSRPSIEIQDESDLDVLSSALAIKADAFVTGDKELLAANTLQGMQILSPREFWEKAQFEAG